MGEIDFFGIKIGSGEERSPAALQRKYVITYKELAETFCLKGTIIKLEVFPGGKIEIITKEDT